MKCCEIDPHDMVVIMDTCTKLNENMDATDGNLSNKNTNNDEAISMRSRLRSRNVSTANANGESTTTSTATATSTIRKVSKIKNNTPDQQNSATVKANSNAKSSSLSTNTTLITANSAPKCSINETSIASSGWPLMLDYCKDECKRMLREYELCAYEQMVRVFRAQGNLTEEKRKLLHTLQQMLSISIERHQGEVRRATFDETLVTIAKRLNCQENSLVETDVTSGWIEEGTRLIPLMPRLVPQTAFHTMANHVAVNQLHRNAAMPLPGQTGNPSRLIDRSIVTSPKITTMTSKRSRLDSVSSTSLIVKSNNTTSTSKASSTTTSQPKTSSSSSSSSSPASLDSPASTTTTTTFKGKCNNKLPLNKVPSVAKATVTSNSGITTTHLAVVRKSVSNILRQSSPCKSMLNCEASIDSLATSKSYISSAKSSNYELPGGHSNVSRVIFVPSSNSSSSSTSSSTTSPPNRIVKSASQVSKLITTSLEPEAISTSEFNSPPSSNVKILHSSTNSNASNSNFPLKKGHSVTVIPSSTYQRLNLVSNKQQHQQVYNTSSKMSSVISATSTSIANGVSSTNSSGVNLPGQGVIIQTYGRTTAGQANGGKKTNLIIVPSSSKSISAASMSVKGSITMSTASSAPTSSIIGKVVVPSAMGTSVLLPSGTSVKRSLVTTDMITESPSKKTRILGPNKDSPKVITLQPAKASPNSMSGRMIGVPGLTAEAVESLIKGHVTPEIMKLVQSAVSASLAKDQEAKQQVTTNSSSPTSKSITSLTNSLPSSITVSKVSSSPAPVTKVLSPTKESITSVASLNSVVKDEKAANVTVTSASSTGSTTAVVVVEPSQRPPLPPPLTTVESSHPHPHPPTVATAEASASPLIASEKEESTSSKPSREESKSPFTQNSGTGTGKAGLEEKEQEEKVAIKVEEQVEASGEELTSDKVKSAQGELKNAVDGDADASRTTSSTIASAKSPQNSLDAVNLTQDASLPSMKEATVNCIKTETEVKPAELNVKIQADDEEQVINEPECNCKVDQPDELPSDHPVHLNDDSIYPANSREVDEQEKNISECIAALSDENTGVKTTPPTTTCSTPECPRIQPIKLSRQGSSWVPFSIKSDDSNESNSDEEAEGEEDEVDEDETPEEDEEEEMDTGMSQTKESTIDEHSVETPLSDLEDEDDTVNNEINCRESHQPLVAGYGSDSNDLSQTS